MLKNNGAIYVAFHNKGVGITMGMEGMDLFLLDTIRTLFAGLSERIPSI